VNIAYISQWFSSSGGGGEVLFIEIARGMSEKGHRIHVISQKLSTDFEDPSTNNIKIHRVRPQLSGFPPSYFQNILFIISATWLGLRLVKREKIDIIHVNNFSPVIIGTILSKICKIPLVKTFHVVFSATHNYWKNWSMQSNVSRLTSVVGPFFEKLTIWLPADIIHAVSQSTKKHLIEFKAKPKIVVIPNIVNLSYFEKLDSNKTYGENVLFVGRLVYNKNLNVVISTFAKVVEKVPNAKLIVVGTGPMLEEWKKMAHGLGLNDNIIFTGFIDENEKLELFGKTSAFVLPSITEGLPTIILEAFAMKTPVIVSDIEPHREIITEGIDGFLIPLDDLQKWAEKIVYILSNKDECKKLGLNGRTKVEKDFSGQSVINELESVYKDLIQ
jgi:glycosyltransferase involved in cell wall biosynthesis